jgi:hypothetical protein
MLPHKLRQFQRHRDACDAYHATCATALTATVVVSESRSPLDVQ